MDGFKMFQNLKTNMSRFGNGVAESSSMDMWRWVETRNTTFRGTNMPWKPVNSRVNWSTRTAWWHTSTWAEQIQCSSSAPHPDTVICGILSGIPSGILSRILSDICSDILSDVLSAILFWHSIWDSIWYIFWNSIWHSDILSEICSDILSGILSGILSDPYSGILFGILPDICFGMLPDTHSDILSDIYFNSDSIWHSVWHFLWPQFSNCVRARCVQLPPELVFRAIR